MAVLALGAVGAAVGWGVAGTATAALWGAQIGFAVGNYMFGGTSQTIQGPRVGDVARQTASEGNPRPWVFGVVRPIGGCIIAAAELDKVIVRETQSGGKGSKSKTTVEREELYRTYAIRVCEGPISRFRRIWRNGKLVYDAMALENDEDAVEQRFLAGSGGVPVIMNDLNENSDRFLDTATLYLGTFGQLPDPALESAFGVGNVPPHRGTAYMVMDREDLTQEGGAIPQWQFEVERCAPVESIYAADESGGAMRIEAVTGNVIWSRNVDPTLNTFYDMRLSPSGDSMVVVGWTGANQNRVTVMETGSGNTVRTFTSSEISDFNHGCCIDDDGNTYVATWANGGGLVKFDLDGAVVWRYDTDHVDDGGPTFGIAMATRLDGDHVYVTTMRRLIKLDRVTGNEVWAYTVPPYEHGGTEQINRMAIDEDGALYLARDGVEFIKVDSEGNQVWRFDSLAVITSNSGGDITSLDFSEGWLDVKEGVVVCKVGSRDQAGFINDDNTFVWAVNAETGELIQEYDDSTIKADFLSDIAFDPQGVALAVSGGTAASLDGAKVFYNSYPSGAEVMSAVNPHDLGATLKAIEVR